jgi:hypothetical protein
MRRVPYGLMVIVAVGLAVLGGRTFSAQDKYSMKVPNGLAFSEFRGYEGWQTIAVSQTEATNVLRVILGNPAMIEAFREGGPGDGKPFPDGAMMAKIVWKQKELTTPPFSVSTPDTVPDTQEDVEFMVKDSKRFADSGGWGWGVFEYDAAAHTFRPGNLADKPPQGNDAKCGLACHTIVKTKDYVFTAYATR